MGYSLPLIVSGILYRVGYLNLKLVALAPLSGLNTGNKEVARIKGSDTYND